MRRRHSKSRRGVLLLVVLGLLAMFAMVAVTFVVLTGQERKTAEIARGEEQFYDPPQKTLEQARSVLMNGSLSPASAVHANGLLEKIYGHEWLRSLDPRTPNVPAFRNIKSVLGGPGVPGAPRQLLEFDLPDAVRHAGCVLTVVSSKSGSPAVGLSTRIVGVNPSNPNRAQIMAFDGGVMPAEGDVFLINGRPYSGMGLGYNPLTGLVDQIVSYDPSSQKWSPAPPDQSGAQNALPLALLPNNYLNWGAKDGNLQNTAPGNLYPLGGANCDYTAPDFQDTLLAFQAPAKGSATLETLLPSLHRPDLVAYWTQATGNGTDFRKLHPVLLRQIMFRPVGMGMPNSPHPQFSGSNPSVGPSTPWNPIAGPWDVDCDGDGAADSVWVDLGLPVRYAPDGRAYKPLFAVLCVDQDGRLNLNAHGSLAQAQAATLQDYLHGPKNSESRLLVGVNGQLAGATLSRDAQTWLPRGLGSSPAEINLLPILSTSPPNDPRGLPQGAARYEALLRGNPTGPLPLAGRYGEPGARNPLPGISTLSTPRPQIWNKWLDYSGDYWDMTGYAKNPGFPLDAYGTPPDHGFGAVGFDSAGRPLYMGLMNLYGSPVCSMGGPIANTPCEIDLSRNAPHTAFYAPVDSPFGPGELERLLRPFDRDSITLPDRLATLLGRDPATGAIGLPTAEQWKRGALTTESWDVPVPALTASPSLRKTLGEASAASGGKVPDRPRSIVDLITAALVRGGMPPAQAGAQAAALAPQLLPPELLAGLKMNLNRPLPLPNPPALPARKATHGVPGALSDAEEWIKFSCDPSGVPLDPNPMKAAIKARQQMARHLYILMTLLADNGEIKIFSPAEVELFGNLAFRQRRIAQWAINVVSFATPDSIMVPFKYPIEPFTPPNPGWYVDDPQDPYRIDFSNPNQDAQGRQCGLVWGCKPQELLLTETLAFHDRRVADTAKGRKRTEQDPANPGDAADADLDQPRMPQGSLFFELFCPRSPINAVAPPDLYTYANGAWHLDLGRVAPNGFPVWRVVVGRSTAPGTGRPDNNVGYRLTGRLDWFPPFPGAPGLPNVRPDSCSLETPQLVNDPFSPAPFTLRHPPSTEPGVPIERIIWLAPVQPAPNLPDRPFIYYNRNGARLLAGGQYALVGPRPETAVGSLGSGGAYPRQPSPQRIFVNSPASVASLAGGPAADPLYANGKQIRPVLGMVCAADWPATWRQHGTSGVGRPGIGISISEPLTPAYYPEPAVRDAASGVKDLDGQVPMEWYGSPGGMDAGARSNPLEGDPNVRDTGGEIPRPGLLLTAPLIRDRTWTTGTYDNYKTLFLQRLANPLLPHNFDPTSPDYNPYLTVDWMPVDLTVFNGEDRQPPDWVQASPWDPDDEAAGALARTRFSTRQRGLGVGGPMPPPGDPLYCNLWMPLSERPRLSRVIPAASAIFPCQLQHSLGYLNQAFQYDPTRWPPLIGRTAEPYVGDPGVPDGLNSPPRGLPFPWITWNGRPYASALELLQVPAATTARLGWEFQPMRETVAVPPNPYSPGSADDMPFPHLLDFFFSTRADPAQPRPARPPGAQLLRLLDFVSVPSRFVQTETMLPPSSASQGPGTHSFHPPFHRVPSYREPGKINLNTIACQEVFQGLLNYCPGLGDAYPGQSGKSHIDTEWEEFVRSRRGYDIGDQADLAGPHDAQYPTRFGRPYRSAAGATLQPVIGPPFATAPPNWQAPHEADQTLLRHRAETSDYPHTPLFELNNLALGPKDQVPDYYHWNRNPHARYQSIQRLADLTTTRSNVFAVWITVGYFEVTQVPPDDAHPDGWQLGQELGSDTGAVERHRAFYLIDRSIPVGFQRGVDINSDRAVLIRRFIE